MPVFPELPQEQWSNVNIIVEYNPMRIGYMHKIGNVFLNKICSNDNGEHVRNNSENCLLGVTVKACMHVAQIFRLNLKA